MINQATLRELGQYLLLRNKIWKERRAGVANDHPVFSKRHLTNVYRELDYASQCEIKVTKGLPFDKIVRFISMFRHSITLETTLKLLKPKCDRKILEALRAKNPGLKFISHALQFFPKPGMDRIDYLLMHRAQVNDNYSMLAERLKAKDFPAYYALSKICHTFSCFGPFRAYEVYTSLTYHPNHFGPTEDDIFVLGPGSVDMFKSVLTGGDKISLDDLPSVLVDLKPIMKRHLVEIGFEFLPEQEKVNCFGVDKFTNRTIEDCMCEFRKFKKCEKTGNAHRRFHPRSPETRARDTELILAIRKELLR